MNVVFIVGSLRKESFNNKLAHTVAKLLPEGAEMQFVDVNVPLFSEDLEVNPPQSVLERANEVKCADAVIILSPEYNRAIPGGLKNLLDWLSRPCTGLPLEQKPVGIGGATPGPVGTAAMQQQLRSVLLHMNAYVLGQPTIMLTVGNGMDAEGEVRTETEERIRGFVDAIIAFAQKVV